MFASLGRKELNSAEAAEGGLCSAFLEQVCSLGFYENVIVVRGHSPVLAMVVFIGVVLLVVREEGVELEALLKVLGSLKTTDVL